MKTVKVYFTNGNFLITRVNGTKKEIKEYYKIGRVFNTGSGARDELDKVKKVEFL